MQRIQSMSLVALLLLAVAGCGGGGDDDPAEVDRATIQPLQCPTTPPRCDL